MRRCISCCEQLRPIQFCTCIECNGNTCSDCHSKRLALQIAKRMQARIEESWQKALRFTRCCLWATLVVALIVEDQRVALSLVFAACCTLALDLATDVKKPKEKS